MTDIQHPHTLKRHSRHRCRVMVGQSVVLRGYSANFDGLLTRKRMRRSRNSLMEVKLQVQSSVPHGLGTQGGRSEHETRTDMTLKNTRMLPSSSFTAPVGVHLSIAFLCRYCSKRVPPFSLPLRNTSANVHNHTAAIFCDRQSNDFFFLCPFTAPLSVFITPQYSVVDALKSATLNCSISGFPISDVKWLKDGAELKVDGVRLQLVQGTVLKIHEMQREDQGMYQVHVFHERSSIFWGEYY